MGKRIRLLQAAPRPIRSGHAFREILPGSEAGTLWQRMENLTSPVFHFRRAGAGQATGADSGNRTQVLTQKTLTIQRSNSVVVQGPWPTDRNTRILRRSTEKGPPKPREFLVSPRPLIGWFGQPSAGITVIYYNNPFAAPGSPGPAATRIARMASLFS